MSPSYIAHVAKDGRRQGLADHLTAVSKLAGGFAEKIGLRTGGQLVGLLHDLGKYSEEFQAYLSSSSGLLEQDGDAGGVAHPARRGSVDHSTAGAQMLWTRLSAGGAFDGVAAQVLALCAASHHSGLIDCVGPDGADLFTRRIAKDDRLTHLGEAWGRADSGLKDRFESLLAGYDLGARLRGLVESVYACDPFETVVRFRLGLLASFLLSCLVDGDHTDSADFERGGGNRQVPSARYGGWLALVSRLEGHLAGLPRGGWIGDLRRKVSDQCLEAASWQRGVYTLTVPTGGGKTLGSLRFALSHALKHGMDRVVYVVPFTTIIEQNAGVARKILETASDGPGTVVLEHHSNLAPEEDTWRARLLAQNWDAPVVFTTSVQFLEALFGGGTRAVRRMHTLARAVIIFDEAQALPVSCVHLFNNAVNFLVEQCGSTAVLCTATQPLLDRVDKSKGAMHVGPQSEIAPGACSLFARVKRADVVDQRKPGGWKFEEVAQLALREVSAAGSCLVVVNTKAAARGVFTKVRETLGDPEARVYHLSANMCPAHRRARLGAMQADLGGKPVVCVSTQVIEAGVDIDFGSVIRFTAGLDSVAQAAGRCNRHAARPTGTVHVVNPAVDPADVLRDIRAGKQAADRVLDEVLRGCLQVRGDLLSRAAMDRYFEYYFFERRREMAYPVRPPDAGRDDTLLNMLSENTLAVGATAPPIYLRQSFMTAARAFKAIDAPTEGVIVPYAREGVEVINGLCSAFDAEEGAALLRRAQRFAVNVFPRTLQRLQNEGGLHEVQEGMGIFHLDARFYHEDFGLTEVSSAPMEMLNA